MNERTTPFAARFRQQAIDARRRYAATAREYRRAVENALQTFRPSLVRERMKQRFEREPPPPRSGSPSKGSD